MKFSQVWIQIYPSKLSTKPQIWSFTTKLQIQSFTTKLQIRSFTTKLWIWSFTTKLWIWSFTTKLWIRIFTLQNCGSGVWNCGSGVWNCRSRVLPQKLWIQIFTPDNTSKLPLQSSWSGFLHLQNFRYGEKVKLRSTYWINPQTEVFQAWCYTEIQISR